MNIDDVPIGTLFYRCFQDPEQHKIVETWIYCGFQEFERTDPDCDLPFHYYKFQLSGGDPQSPYSIRIPSKRLFDLYMQTWDELLEEVLELQ